MIHDYYRDHYKRIIMISNSTWIWYRGYDGYLYTKKGRKVAVWIENIRHGMADIVMDGAPYTINYGYVFVECPRCRYGWTGPTIVLDIDEGPVCKLCRGGNELSLNEATVRWQPFGEEEQHVRHVMRQRCVWLSDETLKEINIVA